MYLTTALGVLPAVCLAGIYLNIRRETDIIGLIKEVGELIRRQHSKYVILPGLSRKVACV